MSDHDIQILEKDFPMRSGIAFAAASKLVLDSGQSVLQSDGGYLFRIFPDGRREEVKRIEPPTPVTPGTIYAIK